MQQALMSDHEPPGARRRMVETVLGPVPDDDLGIILPHEHFPSCRGVSEATEPPAGYMESCERMQREVVREAAGYGVRTVVDVTPIGVLRLVPMMQRISRDTGMHVIASTGFYLPGRRPDWVRTMDAQALADVMIRELTVAMDRVDARAWMIKVAAEKALTDEDRTVFRAAAMASRATGAAITTHSCYAVREHFDVLVDSGADPRRLYLGHADFGEGCEDHVYVAGQGGHLIFTCWGIHHFVDQDRLAEKVVTLVEAGHADAVLLSIDYAIVVSDNRIDLSSMEYECPRRTPGFLVRYALPKLRSFGLDDALLQRLIVDNPRDMLRRPDGGC